jgi:hypothetical protein
MPRKIDPKKFKTKEVREKAAIALSQKRGWGVSATLGGDARVVSRPRKRGAVERKARAGK